MATPVNITAPTTPKKVRIIYDNSQIGTTETPVYPVNVAPPPVADLSQVELTPVNTPVQPYNVKLIEFSDLVKMYVKQDWVDKCPILNNPVIFSDSVKFKKYIVPLLNGDTLRWSSDVDTMLEIGDLINEISKYQVQLTAQQVQDISDASGITKKLNKIITYIKSKKDGCLSGKSYKKRFDQFVKLWNEYVSLLGLRYNDITYENYKADCVINTMLGNNIYKLLIDNIQHNNIVYTFAEYFEDFVVKKKETFSNILFETANNVDLQTIFKANDIVSVIINLIEGVTTEQGRAQIIKKITGLLTSKGIAQ